MTTLPHEFVVRPATAADHAAVLALNNASTPHVNALTASEFAQIVAMSKHFTVAEDSQGILGALLCLSEKAAYWSANFQWFVERYDAFVYVDRVMVAQRVRRGGVGRALYDDLHRQAYARVALEVNVLPPNPTSVAFHLAMGYQPVGELVHVPGEKSVQMFIKELQ
jgi:predicted GNAT superfamily acetyltransferase